MKLSAKRLYYLIGRSVSAAYNTFDKADMILGTLVEEWDTAMVLTAILAPLCIALIVVCFLQWQRINELKNDHRSALGDAAKSQKELEETRGQTEKAIKTEAERHNTQIERQKKEIAQLNEQVLSLNSLVEDIQQHDPEGEFPPGADPGG